MDNYLRVTEILSLAGLTDFSKVNVERLEIAQDFGINTHLACELHDKKILDEKSLDPKIAPYLNQWKKFVKDYGLKIKASEIEKHFISKRFKFQGTPDRITMVDNKITIIDIKTSSSFYSATSLQLAGYKILANENGIKATQRWAVKLSDKDYKVQPYTDNSDKKVFISALAICYWKKQHNLLDKRLNPKILNRAEHRWLHKIK